MSYIEEQLNKCRIQNSNEPEFIQAVTEVIEAINIVVKNDEKYEKFNIIERLVEPDRQIKFRVSWVDDNGNIQVNRGYRVQFNNVLGPYKGGLRFHPSVNMSIIKFLGFEQIFKNALTGLPIGGGKGGADFDPKGKSDREIMSFCQSFMTELYKYIGPNIDVPAGDIGVGDREIGYLFGQYKRIKNAYEGTITGKNILFGGSLIRKEATGYGLLYLTEEMLRQNNHEIMGKVVSISGAGNVAIYAAEKAIQMGAKVVTLSDSTGWIYDENGIDINMIKDIKEIKRERLSIYKKYRPNSKYNEGKFLWGIPCDIALPCATQNELDLKSAENLINNGVVAIAEGANMPTTLDATKLLLSKGILFAPAKAANAGGVAVSALEMSQNSIRMSWTSEEVDRKLKDIMINIFNQISNSANRYGLHKNYIAGANIAGFEKVADAMISQGII